jgi:hypothetical protein
VKRFSVSSLRFAHDGIDRIVLIAIFILADRRWTVDTARLRALRTFPRVQALLRSLLGHQQLVPPEGRFLTLSNELPPSLQDTLSRAESQGLGWCAWHVNDEFAAISADVDEGASRIYARPVLQVFLHDATGRVIGSSGWLETQPGRWASCLTYRASALQGALR